MDPVNVDDYDSFSKKSGRQTYIKPYIFNDSDNSFGSALDGEEDLDFFDNINNQ